MAKFLSRAHDLLIDLRRRNVTRVSISYLVVAWATIEVAAVIFPALSLPSWTVKLVVVLGILGFPVALALAWVFELTTTGIRRDLPASAMASARSGEPAQAGRDTADLLVPGPAAGQLPAPVTPLVGRVAELEALEAHLRDPATRLVTILGPGGVGKTRLALEVARRCSDAFAHGVRFVTLSEVEPDEPLARVLVRSLDIPASEHADPATPLLAFLRQKSLLLVLDNFEQLTPQAGVVSELLAASPGVKALCTSRERLNLRGETVAPLVGLPFTSEDPTAPGADAATLFLRSAARIQPSLSPNEEEWRAIHQICRSVQGLPLALELAAAWAGVLSYQEIAAQIARSNDFLRFGSARDVPERHRSLRAVFEGSWRLMSEPEQQVFRRLSVFRGGFSRAAAEAVAGASLPILSSLADQSLVSRSEAGRFQILQILRQYAAERLAHDPDEARRVSEAHGQYYADYLHHIHERLCPALDREAIAEIEREIDNVREAWRWMVRERRRQEIAQSLEPLFVFYHTRGWAREGSEAFAAARAQAPSRSEEEELLCGRLAAREGALLIQLGQYDRAAELLHGALPGFRTAGNRAEEAFVLNRLGLIASRHGKIDDARAHYERALHAYEEIDHPQGIASVLMGLGAVDFTAGDYSAARDRLQQSLGVSRRLGDAIQVAMALKNLSGVAFIQREYDEANSLLEESLTIDRALGNRLGIANALQNLGCVTCMAGEYPRAEAFLREGIAISREMGFRRLEAYCTNELANVYLAEERLDGAWELYHEALRTAVEIREYPAAMQFLLGMVQVLHRRGETPEALKLLALVLRHPAGEQSTRDEARELWEAMAEAPPPRPGPEDGEPDLQPVLQQLLRAGVGASAPGSH